MNAERKAHKKKRTFCHIRAFEAANARHVKCWCQPLKGNVVFVVFVCHKLSLESLLS